MQNRRYDGVIFDFDGTLVDTGEGILKSLQFAFEDHGRPIPTAEDLKKFIGPPIYYSFTTFYNVSEADVGDYIKSYRKRYREKGIFECRLYDGMEQTLRALKKGGVKLGIASSKPLHLIYDVMQVVGITELFDAVVGTQLDDSRHEGKADLVNESREKLGIDDKTRVLMVGDRYFDIDGAAGAGVDSAGMLYGYGSREEFEAHGATFVLSEATELLPLVFPKKPLK
ncbi:MAG: HAD hydrolase-like protein [Clostridia bacterium]|nr:HAD hydrolase-like protein [Clostridia bacterium]